MSANSRWDAAHAYDISFARQCDGAGRALLERVGAPPSHGCTLLDVGTGTGRLAFEAATRGWSVLAVDPSPPMVEVASSRRPALDIAWVIATVPGLPFAAGSAHAGMSNFVLNHVADPVAFLTDVARVVRPTGLIGTTVWKEGPSSRTALWRRAFESAGLELPASAAPILPGTASAVADAHLSAGLRVELATTITWSVLIDPADLWQGPAAGLASIGEVVGALDEPSCRALYRGFRATTDPLLVGSMLPLELEAVLVLSRV